MRLFRKLFKLFNSNVQQQIIGNNSTGIQIGKRFGCIDRNGDVVTQMGNGSVTVNGVTYTGKNITIKNGNVQIDGKNVTPENDKVISITVEGNINELKVDACEKCIITGEVKSVNTMSGDVEITGNCEGDIETMSGDVNVSGYCSGDIESMSGDIKTGAKLSNNTISDNSSIVIR